MKKYHVGCGFFTIFAGTLNKSEDRWIDKSDVTDEAVAAVAEFLLKHEKSVIFNYEGNKYRLLVRREEGEES